MHGLVFLILVSTAKTSYQRKKTTGYSLHATTRQGIKPRPDIVVKRAREEASNSIVLLKTAIGLRHLVHINCASAFTGILHMKSLSVPIPSISPTHEGDDVP